MSRTRVPLPDIDSFALGGLGVVAVTPFARDYSSWTYLAPVLGAVAVAFLIEAYLSPRRRLLFDLVVQAVAFFAFLVLVVFHFSRGPGGVWDGLVSSWSQNLSPAIPIAETAAVVALPVAISWVAVVSGVGLGLRTEWILAPAIPGFAAWILAQMFTGHQPIGSSIWPILMLVLVLVTAATRANRTRRVERAQRTIRYLSGVAVQRRPFAGMWLWYAVIGVCVVVALGVSSVVPASSVGQRFDLHDYYHQPVQLEQTFSPLAEVPAGLNTKLNGNPVVFKVRFSGIPSGVQIRQIPVATLDQYNGVDWQTSSQFTEVDADLPQSSDPSVGTAAVVEQNYTLQNDVGPFLPALEEPVKISGTGLAFDQLTGSLADTASQLKGRSYSVVSEIPPGALAFDDPDLLSAGSEKQGTDPRANQYLEVPSGVPADLTSFDEQVTGSTELTWLDDLEKQLQTPRFGYSVDAEPGHSLGRLAAMFAVGSAGGQYAHDATAEQFAAAFALLARLRGYPARVVVGYDINQPTGARNGQTISVRSSDITAWDEVDVNGVGWVAFNPTVPTDQTIVQPRSTVTTTPTSVPTTYQHGSLPTPNHSVTTYHNAPPRHGSVTPWIIVLIVVVLSPLSVFGLKLLRRRRRKTSGTVADRVVGAWRETEEHLEAVGVRLTPGMTVCDVVGACSVRLTPDVVRRIADFQPLVDLALYSPEDPEEYLADRAWSLEETTTRLVRGAGGLKTRVRLVADPRPLVSSRARR